jgi:hypothetical protein
LVARIDAHGASGIISAVEVGLYTQMFYPVEGESAIVELYYDDDQWANVWLEGVRLDALGDARLEQARVMVSFFSPTTHGTAAKAGGGPSWKLDLDEVRRRLDDARERLLENERGRVPADDHGLTNAGRAFSKISQTDPRWHPN